MKIRTCVSALDIFLKPFLRFISLFERQSYRGGRKKERDLPSAESLPKWRPWSGLLLGLRSAGAFLGALAEHWIRSGAAGT